ncbi:PGRPLB.2 family protein [Megaselia abdita]
MKKMWSIKQINLIPWIMFLLFQFETLNGFNIINRNEWRARDHLYSESITEDVRYVIIHHSYNPGFCQTTDACKASMRSIQDLHMDFNGWEDIGYTFAIGGDGNVYEGRGYGIVGAHAPNYNNRSIGLLFIGDYTHSLPTPYMLNVAKEFIAYSVSQKQLKSDYKLYGHRQVRETECPGQALYNEIKNWEHWTEN